MARILFIQHEPSEKFGTMILSAVLKNAGHEVDLFIELLEKKSVLEYVDYYRPDIIAFSIATIERNWALELAKKIKKQQVAVIVFGGADPTYEPELLIRETVVDYLCRGEGEEAFVELVKRLKENKSIKGIANLWGKEKGKIVRNKLGKLIKNLDNLPFPDREIYYKYPLLRNLSTKKFLCGRGCLYSCTYCSNHAYLKLFKGLGSYVRYRSPEKIIEEILLVKRKYGFKRIYLADETLTLNHFWLKKFLGLYRKKIGMPFSILGRVNELDEETIKSLKKSGCFYVAFGLESGSERIRNGILKRNMAREDFIRVGQLMHKYHLPFLTHQMYVLPTETSGEALRTVELNAEIGTDSVWDTVFQPFANTELYEFCRKNSLLPKNLKIDSMFGESQIVNPEKGVIENIRRLSWWGIKFPWLLRFFMKLASFPDNLLYQGLLKVSQIYSIRGRWRLGYWEMIRLAWKTGNKLG